MHATNRFVVHAAGDILIRTVAETIPFVARGMAAAAMPPKGGDSMGNDHTAGTAPTSVQALIYKSAQSALRTRYETCRLSLIASAVRRLPGVWRGPSPTSALPARLASESLQPGENCDRQCR